MRPVLGVVQRARGGQLRQAPRAEKTRQPIMCAETGAEMTSHAEFLLSSGLPDRDPVTEQAAHVVALITSDSAPQRVDQLSVACAACSGCSPTTWA